MPLGQGAEIEEPGAGSQGDLACGPGVDEIIGLPGQDLETVPAPLHMDHNLAGGMDGVGLHAAGVHAQITHASQQLVAQGIIAGPADQYRVQAKGLQVTGDIERRPAEHPPVRKHVDQYFTEQDDSAWACIRCGGARIHPLR